MRADASPDDASSNQRKSKAKKPQVRADASPEDSYAKPCKPAPKTLADRGDQVQQPIKMMTSSTQTDFDALPSSQAEPLVLNANKNCINHYEP